MYSAWGKLSKLTGEMHPLEAHMLDVAACFKAIAELPSVLRALVRAAKRPLSPIDLSRLSALAFLHDVGKANAGFQAKRWNALEQPAMPGWPQPCGHSVEALAIFENEELASQFPLTEMDEWGKACLNLWYASISHHGSPVTTFESSQIDSKIWKPVMASGACVYDPKATLGSMGRHLKKWFSQAFEKGPELPANPEFAHLFAGLVQFADWLGSDTHFFPYLTAGEDRNQSVWQRARDALQHIGADPTAWRQALPSLPDFSAVFDVTCPRPIQAKMAEPDLGPLLILESETGSGKTEAALWHFAQLFHQGKVDSLYFALPTRVAATQLYKRVLQFTNNLWKDSGKEPPLVVRALAGYESADGHSLAKKLPDFKVLWADHPDEQKAHQRWAAESSKRYLAAPLAVGTIDQALLSALQVRHAHLRHSLLARSLLVVDEVHASDAYMSALLAHLLKAHLNLGGRALLLSATLGASARHRYQKLVAPGLQMPDLAQAIATTYPALSDGPATHALPNSGRSKQVDWQVKDLIDNPDAIAALAIKAAQQGAKVLIIRNTVPAALATFRAIEKLAQPAGLLEALFNVNGTPTVHHSRYSREDRPLLDQAVEQQIGKHRAKQLKACIVVGTQTLEQSLDIDADLLMTDLCPMDVLLQRVGRLHRHDRPQQERPEAYQTAQAVVLVPNDYQLDTCLKKARHGLGRFHNGGGIYTDLRILEATRLLITKAQSHVIPKDCRELVERATHPEVLMQLAQKKGPEWVAHGEAIDGELHAQRVQANFSTLPFNNFFIEIDENGLVMHTLHFPGKEQQISSRLGSADHLLTFCPAQPGPFGQEIQALPMRHHFWPKQVSLDEQPVIQSIFQEGGFTFTLGQSQFSYSRLGLERITDPKPGEMK
jgi:CRISPR-associated endonuclease/helicase Cas3